MSLLDKALAVPTRMRPPRELSSLQLETVELAVAYAGGRITMVQAAAALGCSPSNITNHLGRSLLAAVRSGRIRIEVVK
jgi:hypothetical protein